jgi:hypothetical protein
MIMITIKSQQIMTVTAAAIVIYFPLILSYLCLHHLKKKKEKF